MYILKECKQVENHKIVLELPEDFTGQEVEVIVFPKTDILGKVEDFNDQIFEERQWHEFIESTYGCLKDDPIDRGTQGMYEIREEM